MILRDKRTGDLYTVAVGRILSPSEVVEGDITGSMVSLQGINSDEYVPARIGYTKEGYVSSANFYEIVDEE